MTTDYDAPRNAARVDQDDDTVTDIQTRRTQQRTGQTDIGEPSVTTSNYYSGLDVIEADKDEHSGPIHAKQDDEFTCASCFLVQHRHLLARTHGHDTICRDCA